MDQKHQNILKQLQQQFIDDLDVNNGIILSLTDEYILKDKDVENINKGRNKQEKAKILLDILYKQNSHAFEIFHQSLKRQYWWLSDEIDLLLEKTSGIIVGDAPFIYNMQPESSLTVRREEMVEKLKSALQIMQPNGYIALHGMKGFGKSCLTASTLKDKELMLNSFNNEVHWIKFGYKHNLEEEILIQLNNLYHQIKNLNPIMETINLEPLEENLMHTIQNYFRKSTHKKALLILDDVCHREVINKFDFACKTLVITADLGVLSQRNYLIVKMDHGFTEKETLGLFAKILKIEIDQLPSEAKFIHDECKGMPLLIAMLAAQFENFKHDMNHNNGRWKYYLDCLRTKDSNNKVIEEFLKIQETTFDMCINQLEEKMKERYENLVIFSEDVNIMPKTLEILWEDKPFSVDEIMLDFCCKSLAAKKWNDDLHSYIYGVHDLLLSHLRKKLKPIQLRDKHRSFIQKYRKYCDGDFSKLPNDNYSLFYIGHHLEQAELFEEFHALYMNFDFLQAKINYTGLNDLLIDLKKYRKYITNNNEIIESNIQDLEKFLESQANTFAKHRLMKCLDLIQIALNYSEEGFVKNIATKLALSRTFSLYLSFQSNLQNDPYSDICKEYLKNTATVVFTNEPNHILVGSLDGEVILWNCENHKQKIFHGHNKKYAIKKIILSFNGDYFLALSEDGSAKLFALHENDITNDLSIPIQSPQHKQIFWKGVFDITHDNSLKTFHIEDEYITDIKFSQINNRIVGCTNQGTVLVWDIKGNCEWTDKCINHHFGGVEFTTKDNLLHIMDETISVVRIYKKNEKNGYTYVSQFNLQLDNPIVISFSKHPVEDNCLVIITSKTVLYFKWFYNNDKHLHNFDKKIKIEEKNKDIDYVAATLTYDARYLIIGNSKGIISVIKAFNPDDFITYFKGYVTSLDSYWMYYEDFHLICGNEKKWIHRWKVGADEKPKSVKKLLFDAKMENIGKENIVALKTSPHIITIFSGKKLITKIESLDGRIARLNFYDDASKLIYITELGSVIVYNMKTEQTKKILQLDCIDNFIDILLMQNNFMVVCRANNILQVYKNMKISKSIEESENVIRFKKIDENFLISVSSDGKLKYWRIENFEWQKICECLISDTIITNCYFSKFEFFLVIVENEKKLLIYKISFIDSKKFGEVENHINYEYKGLINFCEFSNDNKYLAVSLEGGDISIIDILERLELGRLSLHSCTVTQLVWSPLLINAPILLSVSYDELAWWNIMFLKIAIKSQNRRSRMGFIPNLNSPNLQASCNEMMINQSIEHTKNKFSIPSSNVNDYWSYKHPKNQVFARPALLSCVQLPSSCTGEIKICVSNDFSKFLTVDIHGTIINYSIFSN